MGLIRFFATAGEHNLGRMIGGRFQGCADGPDGGCHTLATVDERPDFGWNELPVGDGGRYRWLRYVGPAGGYSTVAEVEFIAPSSDVTVQAPDRLRRLGANEVVTTYRNTTGRTVRDLRLSLGAYATRDRAARAVQPAGRTRFEVVGPGRSVSARWQVDVPLPAAAGDYHLVADAVHADGRSRGSLARRSARRSTRSSTPSSPRSTGARPSRRSCGSPTTPPAR